MKKILFHISSLYGGGAERVMSNLINYFNKEKYEVILVVCYEKEGEYEINSNVRKYVLSSKSDFKKTLELRKIIKKENPDISLSFMEGSNIRLTLANLFSNRRYILSIRNDPKKEYRNIFTKLFAKIFFNFANGIVFQTQDAMKYFSKKIQNKSTIIYNSVDKSFFASDRNENVSGIVSFGRLTTQKNFELLINAYSKISDEIEDNLYIYGEGELKTSLQNLIEKLNLKNKVKLMGRTDNVKEVLYNSKLFVMSSDYEGMPNALLEAFCMLVPSISTDCPCGGAKMILKEDFGLLVPIGDEDKLSKCIKEILLNSELQKKYSRRCFEGRERFNSEVINNKWKKYIENKLKS